MHRILVRLENATSHTPGDTISLLIELRKTAECFGSVVKNLRVTEKAIEFDLYVLDSEKRDLTLKSLESKFGREISEVDLEIEETTIPDKMEVLRQSVYLFNEQRYWECHETLEQIWRREPIGAEKNVQQGIILAASALVHYQKNETDVCLGMIPRTIGKLDSWHEKMYFMIDIGHLKQELRKIQETRLVRPFAI